MTQATLIHMMHRFIEMEKYEEVNVINQMMINFLRLLGSLDSPKRKVNRVNKNEWVSLANMMWTFSETNDGKMSKLIKELILKINENMEVILDDMGEHE